MSKSIVNFVMKNNSKPSKVKHVTRTLISMFMVMIFLMSTLAFAAIPVKSIKLKSTSVTIEVGKTFKLSVALIPANTTQKLLTYSSSNRNLVSVDKNGIIKGIKFGKASITVSSASNKNVTVKCNVTVKPASIVTEAGTFPITKKKYNMTIFASQMATIENMATNELTKAYEEKTNVHIIWEMAPQNILEEKRKISLASGDYPDIYLSAGIKKDEEIIYGAEGIFLPLNNLIDKYGYWVKKSFVDKPEAKIAVTTPDGNIYSLPMISDAVHVSYSQKLWLNTKWLKKLNLASPKTTEDFYKVLKAFKENDPNGNGKKDEIPFMTAAGSGFVNFLMNSFIQNDATGRFVNNEGKIDVAYNKPEWKKGTEYLKKLVSEGLLDATTFSATMEQLKQIAEKPDAEVLGAFVMLSPSIIFNMAGERHKSFDSIAPLKGPDGIQHSIWNPYSFYTSGNFVVTSRLKNPEVAIRWIDWFYSFEGGLLARIGREGKEWRRAEPNEKSYTGAPATWAKVTALGGVQNFFWSQWNIAQHIRHTEQLGNEDIYSSDGAAIETRLYKATRDNYEPFRPKKVIPPLYIESREQRRIAQSENDIKTYVDENIVRFATGNLDINKEWDNYVRRFDSIGLKDVLSVYQKAYDSYLRNSKK